MTVKRCSLKGELVLKINRNIIKCCPLAIKEIKKKNLLLGQNTEERTIIVQNKKHFKRVLP